MRLKLAALMVALSAVGCPKNDTGDQQALIPTQDQKPQTPTPKVAEPAPDSEAAIPIPPPEVPEPITNTEASSAVEYVACGCGCCGGGRPSSVICLDTDAGQTLEAVIEKDRADSKRPICAVVGCSLGVLYRDCGGAPHRRTR